MLIFFINGSTYVEPFFFKYIKIKVYSFKNADILHNSLIGVEFEFYSNKSIKDTAKEIGELLDKKIRIETKAHSEFQPNDKEFKIEPDMSGGKKLMELVTGALPYQSARLMIIKVSNWIQQNGYTNEKSSIHLNISFDPKKTGDKYRISKMNVLKFILDFKEDQVFEFFPNRKNSTYAKSIKFVVPTSDTYYYDGLNINSNNFVFPTSKYYGVNFEKRNKGYLEFRYLGGKDWEKQTTNILYLVDRFLVQLWHSTGTNTFNPGNNLELKRILTKNQNIIDSRKDWRHINKNWPDIKFTVDLKEDPKVIDIHWQRVKDRVMKLFTHGTITKGHINYDSDGGRVQISGGKLLYCVDIYDYEFVDSYIQGEVSRCDFFGCNVFGSDIMDCNFYQSTDIISSKVKTSYVSDSCKLRDCYVYGKGILKGSMDGGIFREGIYDKNKARFSKETEKIDYIEI